MLFAFLYFLIRRILGTGRRPQDERDIELLVLRHQVRVLQRQVKRPTLRRVDRILQRRRAGRCRGTCGPPSW
jgi:putative transposase